ncbi:Uncharacterized protein FKW44_012078, partial [Caligus rogercresseyi]
AVGAKGFKAIWTEIKDGPSCDEFHCFPLHFVSPARSNVTVSRTVDTMMIQTKWI